MMFYNYTVDKGRLKKLIASVYRSHGSARCAQLADGLKDLGFRYATQAGVSISVNDLTVPPAKKQMLEEAEQEIRMTEQRFARGEITEVERFQKVIDTWNGTSELLKDEVIRNFRVTDPLNSVYMMAFSGARGNMSQVRQLVGMRGLMANPQGELIDLPIKTNFREGLTVTEYIISSYGARKGLVDTALRTADSGYLTRRLVDVAQDVIVREVDCGTDRSITVTPMKDGDRVLIPLADRLLGRILAEDFEVDGEIIAKRNQDIDDDLAKKIGRAREEIKVRSPLTCESSRSVCQHCYGWSLAHGHMVDMGEAIGIIAAQSIGEPGTQLTMRTFHTGGVFTGEVARSVKSPIDGTIRLSKELVTRRIRTPHGDDCEQIEVSGDLTVVPLAKGVSPVEYHLNPGSLLFVEDGAKVEAGHLIIEESTVKLQRSTERATKDVATILAGEIFFANIVPEEKTDRQGNTTRIAGRSGLVWILSGEVYNLPPGAEATVNNDDYVEEGNVLAETKLITNNGGLVRTILGSREIEIVTASAILDSAQVKVETTGGREQYIIQTVDGQRFALKTTPGTKVPNHSIIAELIDDRYRTTTGGIVKYAGIEISKGGRKQGYEIIKGGTLVWVPEETHEVNKDIGLLNVEDGEYVEAGTEVVKDIFCQSSGVVEIIQKNDILREIIIKPGDIYRDIDPDWLMTFESGSLVQPGTEIIPGVVVGELRQGDIVETTEGMALLLRPVEEYTVSDEPASPSQGSINQEGDRTIELRSVQRLYYKDGERVRSVEGTHLLSTQLVLEMSSQEKDGIIHLTADIEIKKDEKANCDRLQLVILESLTLRRDSETDPYGGSVQTRVLVQNGQQIPKGAVVARTEIQCKENGYVRGIQGGNEVVRRILVMRESDQFTLTIPGKSKLKVGDLLVAGTILAPGVILSDSGQVVSLKEVKEGFEVKFRSARPYRVSAGAILHVEHGDLVQRGDNLVLLVFERAKTGDIIQGLPRIEELLEARKPREACVLARKPGICQVEYANDETVDIKVIEEDGMISEYPLLPGQISIVSDGQKVEGGEPLTDGPSNPHELLETYFNLHLEVDGIQEGTIKALRKTQKSLVDSVQSVYQSQGIDISDKHIEVIVRQMTYKVRIDDGGDSTALPGELVELRGIEKHNETVSLTGQAPVKYTPVLLGITKASLNTDSFISAASFQETTRVLTEAAIEGKSDWLRGLKENVIIGRLIPAGTGFGAHEDAVAAAAALLSEPIEDNAYSRSSYEMGDRHYEDEGFSNSLTVGNLDNDLVDDHIARRVIGGGVNLDDDENDLITDVLFSDEEDLEDDLYEDDDDDLDD